MIKIPFFAVLVSLLVHDPWLATARAPADISYPSIPRYRQLMAWLTEASMTNVSLLDATLTINLANTVERHLLAEMISVVDWVKGWANTDKQSDVYEVRATNLLKIFLLSTFVQQHIRRMHVVGSSDATQYNLKRIADKKDVLLQRIRAIDTLFSLTLKYRLLSVDTETEITMEEPYFWIKLSQPKFARFYWTEPRPLHPLWSAYDLPPITVSLFECFARPIPTRPLYNYVNEIILLHRAQLFVLDAYNGLKKLKQGPVLKLIIEISNVIAFIEFVRDEYAFHQLNAARANLYAHLFPNVAAVAQQLIENDLVLQQKYTEAQSVKDGFPLSATISSNWETPIAVFVLLDGGRRVEVAVHNRTSPNAFIIQELARQK